jgi:hypothetical protein
MATPSFQRILEVLDEHGVELIVVGGVAPQCSKGHR